MDGCDTSFASQRNNLYLLGLRRRLSTQRGFSNGLLVAEPRSRVQVGGRQRRHGVSRQRRRQRPRSNLGQANRRVARASLYRASAVKTRKTRTKPKSRLRRLNTDHPLLCRARCGPRWSSHDAPAIDRSQPTLPVSTTPMNRSITLIDDLSATKAGIHGTTDGVAYGKRPMSYIGIIVCPIVSWLFRLA